MDTVRNLEQLQALMGTNHIIPNALPFYGHKAPIGVINEACLSQHYPCIFYIEGIRYNCIEQYMMAMKTRVFRDAATEARIMASTSPMEQKILGRQVSSFDDAVWRSVAVQVVTLGNIAKFAQNIPLQKFLLSTGDAVLIEASPTDKIWGIGRGAEAAKDITLWRGSNLLGFALMEVRQRIIELTRPLVIPPYVT